MRLIWIAVLVGLSLAQRVADMPVLVKTEELAGGIGRIAFYSKLRQDHVTTAIAYPIQPPVGGAHFPFWLNCGVYNQPVNNPLAVHSLEHGALWITYRPGLPEEQLTQLKALTKASGYRLLSPYPGLRFPVVLTVWGVQLMLERYDEKAIQEFAEQYTNNPEFTPEPGAPCEGGVGSPER